MTEPILVVAKLARVLDQLGIPYIVGGSLASSVYGTPRSTLDADLIVDIPLVRVDDLVRALSSDFHIDPVMVRDAVRNRDSFNVVHLATMFKADIFIAGEDAWSREELSRGRSQEIETSEGKVAIRFASAEDSLLHKLYWYQLGNEVSERQWTDVLGMLRIQGSAMDHEYLARWAEALGVADLLARAREAARSG